MVDGGKPIVIITGITGFIGAETCKQFLEDGNYRVRGTVRDKTNEAKIAPIREAFGPLFDQLELVEADLMNEQSMIDAVAGSTYVVHIASPFFFGGTEEEVITPAVNGTLACMRACEAAGVRRCVLTSSLFSIMNMAEADKPADRVFDESHWSNVNREEPMEVYAKSKVLAEKAAWDFVAALPADKKFELVAILPAFVMGPPLRKENFSSGGWLQSLMYGKMEKIESRRNCVVDVRNAAFGHLAGVKVAAAAGKRFILCQGSPSFIDYAAPVIAKYAPLGWPITQAKEEVRPEEKFNLFNNTASKEVLGVDYIDFSKTMVDMADKMVELGTLSKDAPAQ